MEQYPTTDLIRPEIWGLFEGRPARLHFKARDVTVLLTPGSLYGYEEHVLIVAGLGKKCAAVDLRQINLTPMIQAGLSAHAAGVLKSELERTYAHASKIIEA